MAGKSPIYSWRAVDQPVSIILIGQESYAHPKLCCVLSAIKDTTVEWQRYVNAFVDVLNLGSSRSPDFPGQFQASFELCQSAIDEYILASDVKVQKDSDHALRYWVRPKKENYRRVKNELIAIGKVTSILAPILWGGRDPAKLDNAAQEQIRARLAKYPNRKARRDVFRIYRLAGELGIVPRFEDPRISVKWLTKAAKLRVPEVIMWLVRFGRMTGARSSSLLPLTFADIFVRGRSPFSVAAPGKNSAGERFLQLVLTPQVYGEFTAFLERDLLARTGQILSEVQKLSEAELDAFPLFSEEGLEHIDYERLARIFRTVSREAGLTYTSYGADVTERSVGFHHLRHEYVFSALAKIDKMPEDQRETARLRLTKILGWRSGLEMLDWYSHHFDMLFGMHLAAELADDVCYAGQDQPEPTRAAIGPSKLAGIR